MSYLIKKIRGTTIKTKLNAVELFIVMNDILINNKLVRKLIPANDYIPGGESGDNYPGTFTISNNKVGHEDTGVWTSMTAGASYGELHSAWVPVNKIQAFGYSKVKDFGSKYGKHDGEMDKVIATDSHPHIKVNSGMYDYASKHDLKHWYQR